MARKTPSRLELRKQAEAVEKSASTEEKKKTTKAKSTTARPKRTKEKVIARKRLVWVVYSGSMKEEGRFPYDQKAAAEGKIEQLRLKSKKMYFIQPVKELIGEGGVVIPQPIVAAEIDDEPVKPKKKVVKSDDDEDEADEEPEDDDSDE